MFHFDKFEDIPAWQEARELTGRVYEYTSQGPWALDDCLRHDIREAAINVTSKIAMGFDRQDVLEFRKSLSSARALTAAIRTHLYLAMDLEFIDQDGFDAVDATVESTRNMIDMLATSLKRGPSRRER